MILLFLILIPLAGGLTAWLAGKWRPGSSFWISLAAAVSDFLLTVFLWIMYIPRSVSVSGDRWLIETTLPWIPQFGISIHLAIDGLSLILVSLAGFLGIMAVTSSRTEIKERHGFFHFNLLAVLAGIIGVFLAMDLFLFYFFWELMLVPMYFLIAIWGHENRFYAAIKFFLFTQLSGLFMLAAIIGLYLLCGNITGTYTFDYLEVLGVSLPVGAERWLFLGFFVAFAVKLPLVPIHSWLPDAHTEAPTAGSVILAGLLLKTGAYGLIRFAIPLFPEAASHFAPLGMILGVIGILYGAAMAFAQTDLKRLIAYTSISHMGFVILGVFAWNTLALQGALMQIVCHGLSTGALFMIVGGLQERIHTRDIQLMGGLWSTVPKMAAVTLFFALASLGLPGLGNFVAEFLVLIGAYRTNIGIAVVATTGLVTATVYSLWMMHVCFFGSERKSWRVADLSFREMASMASIIALLLWFGLYPQPLLNSAERSLEQIMRMTPEQSSFERDLIKQARLSPPDVSIEYNDEVHDDSR